MSPLSVGCRDDHVLRTKSTHQMPPSSGPATCRSILALGSLGGKVGRGSCRMASAVGAAKELWEVAKLTHGDLLPQQTGW